MDPYDYDDDVPELTDLTPLGFNTVRDKLAQLRDLRRMAGPWVPQFDDEEEE